MLSRKTVDWGFRSILGRDISGEPDHSPGVIAHRKLDTVERLVDVLISSAEFQDKLNKKQSCQVSLNSTDSVYDFVVIGNCQALRIAEILSKIFPSTGALGIELLPSNLKKLYENEFRRFFDKAKHVIFQGSADHPVYKFISGSIDSSRISLIPPISFVGFQPDNGYVINLDNKPVSGPLGHYQSILAFWGWKNGFSPKDTVSLFCDSIYRHLGYYDLYNQSRKELLSTFNSYPYPLADAFLRWRSKGCFMHSVNHPKIHVLADLVRMVLDCLGYGKMVEIEPYLEDQFTSHGCWPVYPEIGERLGINGSYDFKKIGKEPNFISLSEFIGQSHQVYSSYSRDHLDSLSLKSTPFRELLPLAQTIVAQNSVAGFGLGQVRTADQQEESANPYKSLPDHCFWKRGVALVSRGEVDPVVLPRFGVGKDDLVATAGSCFAQHIAKRLSVEGFNYYVPEDGASLPAEERTERNYGVFSCRYGNVYTTRQLVQLFDRSMGRFTPKEGGWKRPDGRYVDPFRPQIEPAGFESEEAMLQSRSEHLGRVKEMFTKLDILVFTLGLTESWESMEDGAVFPLAPGVVGGAMDPARHRFRNMTAKEVADDLELFLLKLEVVNPKARVILTVSPVPLIATYENRHVLVSNTHSKSTLRTVAGEMASRYPQCEYFPSYEIITGQHAGNDYLEEDLRSVRSEGVDHVMRIFLKHYAGKQDPAQIDHKAIERETEQKAAIQRINAVICDEEALSN